MGTSFVAGYFLVFFFLVNCASLAIPKTMAVMLCEYANSAQLILKKPVWIWDPTCVVCVLWCRCKHCTNNHVPRNRHSFLMMGVKLGGYQKYWLLFRQQTFTLLSSMRDWPRLSYGGYSWLSCLLLMDASLCNLPPQNSSFCMVLEIDNYKRIIMLLWGIFSNKSITSTVLTCYPSRRFLFFGRRQMELKVKKYFAAFMLIVCIDKIGPAFFLRKFHSVNDRVLMFCRWTTS